MEISLDRENVLEFNVDIQGYANTPTKAKPKVRMVIGNNALSICLPAIREGEDYRVTIPEMKNLLEAGKYEASLEVILGNKFFVPWESVLTFDNEVKVEEQEPEEEVEVKVEAAPVVKQSTPQMKVTAKPVLNKVMTITESAQAQWLDLVKKLELQLPQEEQKQEQKDIVAEAVQQAEAMKETTGLKIINDLPPVEEKQEPKQEQEQKQNGLKIINDLPRVEEEKEQEQKQEQKQNGLKIINDLPRVEEQEEKQTPLKIINDLPRAKKERK